MPDRSIIALQQAISAQAKERRQAIIRHNGIHENDKEYMAIGDIPEEIDSVLWELCDAYENARKTNPGYPPYETLVRLNDQASGNFKASTP
jgi:hypothetical protein